MASSATLGFSILSRYSGHGVTQARRDLTALRAQMGTINGDLQRHTNFLSGIPSRWKAIGGAAVAVAPAMIPISAAALQVAGAFTVMSVAVGTALGVYGAAMKGAITRTLEMAKAGKALSPVQKGFVSSVDGMRSAWAKFIKETSNQTLSTATHAVRGLAAGIKLLKPLVDAVHPSVLQVAKDFESWMKGDSAKNYSKLIADIAKTSLPNLMRAGQNVLNVLGDGFRAFAPLADDVALSILKGSEALKAWSDGGGFQRFLEYVRSNGPEVRGFFRAFGEALSNVFNILREFSGGGLHLLTDALRAIAAIDPATFKAFASALLLIKSPLAWMVLNCPPLRDAMIGLLGAMNPQTIYAIAAAFVVMKLAIFAMNAGLIATPVGWIIIALAGLAVAITWIATKTTWFQTAWTYTWNAIKHVTDVVWQALQIAWHATVGALVLAWQTVSAALTLAWNTVWNAMSTAVGVVWAALQIAWAAFTGALALVWTTVSTALTTAWTTVWNAIATAAQFVWTALTTAWNAFITGVQLIWTTVSTALSAAWGVFWNAISTAARFVWTALQIAWSTFITALQTIWTTVSTALSSAWNAVWNAIRTAATTVWNAIKAAWQAVLSAIQTAWNTVSNALKAAWNAAWNAIKTVATTIWEALKAAWNAMTNRVRAIWDMFYNAFKTAWSAAWSFIKNTATVIWEALKGAWNAMTNRVRAIWDMFYNAFKTAWETAWNFIKDKAVAIWDALKGAWNAVTNRVQEIWDTFYGFFSGAWEKAWNTVKDVAKEIWDQIVEVVEKAINILLTPINMLIKGFNAIAGVFGIDDIPEIKVNFAAGGMVGSVPSFAVGGTVNFAKGGGTIGGYAPGRDTVPAMLSRGEGVLTPEAVRGMGGPGFVHAANRKFAGHRGAGKDARAPLSRYTGSHDWSPQSRGGPDPGKKFANGGVVGGVQHFAVGGITAAALAKAGVSLGMVTQGENSNGSLSGGTHLGGGAVDIGSTSPSVLAALKAAGFAAWIRGPADGMAPHIHAVLMNHPGLSGAAAAQVQSFMAGGTGLGVGGGSGGNPFADLFGNIGEIIYKIVELEPVNKVLGAILGIGDGGGILGTGIGPDVGPNIAGAITGKSGIGGMMMEMLFSMVEMSHLDEGFKDREGAIMDADVGTSIFGKIVKGFPTKILEAAKDFIFDEKPEMPTFTGQGLGVGGGVQQWAPLAAMALARAGLSASQLPAFLALMQAESGGNPMAQNNWDSNAAMNQASRGLMQVIPSTFAAHRDPGLSANIFDPLANMTAAARYIKSRYGGVVPGSPYALGTPGATSGTHLVGEQGPELLNFRGGETVTPAKETASILGGGMEQMAPPALPEDPTAQYQMLIQLAQEMAARTQQAWALVSASSMNAKTMLTPIHQELATQLGTTLPAAFLAMQTASATAWTAMQTQSLATWTVMKDGTFTEANDHMAVKMPEWGNQMNSGVSTAWQLMGEATAAAWEGMKEGTRGPTNWIIDNAYNNGLARLWNEVAAIIFEDGARTLPTVATLAKGGPVHGPGGERADRVPAMLSRGEHVWTAREVHRAGGHHAVQQMRQGIMGRKVRGAHDGHGFAGGGWLSGVGNVGGGFSASLGELKRGSMMDEAEPFLDTLDSTIKGSLAGSMFRRMGGSASGLSPSDWMRQYIEKDDELNKIGSGGPPWIPGVSDARTTWGGVAVNQRTADMLNMAMTLGGSFSATQGSFSTGVAASAGTHDGGGVVDLVPASNGNVAALRAVGFAAWNRGAGWGSPSFSPHIHAVALGDPTVSGGAAAQVMSYLAGGNGLADGGPDNFSGGIPAVDGVAAIGGGRNVDPADLEQNVVSFDRGGFLQPGYTMAYNGTGKPEPVGHHLVPRGSQGDVHISMPITVQGNLDQKAVATLQDDVLPQLLLKLKKGTGNN